MIEGLWDIDAASYYISFDSLAFLVEALILIWIGKWIHDLVTPYSINAELTEKDNKAVAISYAGYLVAQALVILGVLQGASRGFYLDLMDVAIWSLIGIVLLNLSMFINNAFILRKFDNVKEIVEDRNVGTAAVQCGTFIGAAFIIRSVIMGEFVSWQQDLLGVAIFFVVGQLAFILFTAIYQGVTRYDVHAEIERDNVAAGVGFGMTLAAIGVILSNTIVATYSLVAFGVWFVTGVVLIVVTRILVDKLVLPNHNLESEICEDQNWGAALLEGSAAVMVAFLLNASFA